MITKKYSLLVYNFNNYEKLHMPDIIDEACEYVYVTDDTTFKNDIFKVIVPTDMDNLSAFEKCYKVRFNLFNYCSTDVCIYIDGSLQIKQSLERLYNNFIYSNCDIGLNIHECRTNFIDEYYAWQKYRNYDIEQIKYCLNYMRKNNYDFNYKGLYQGTIRICKNTELNKEIDTKVLQLLYELKNNMPIERIDQIIYSYIINTQYKLLNIFPLSSDLIFNTVFNKFKHNTTINKFSVLTAPYFDYGYVNNILKPLFK